MGMKVGAIEPFLGSLLAVYGASDVLSPRQAIFELQIVSLLPCMG